MACRVSSIHTLLARGATTCSFTEVLWNDEAISHWLFAAFRHECPLLVGSEQAALSVCRLVAQARKEYLPFYTYMYQKHLSDQVQMKVNVANVNQLLLQY